MEGTMKITGEMVYAAYVHANQHSHSHYPVWETMNDVMRFPFKIMAAHLSQQLGIWEKGELGTTETGEYYEHAFYAYPDNEIT